MSVLISGIAFFLLLSVLILIHEFGHFIAARWSKVVVEEFGFGLPPKAKHLFTQAGTMFTFNWVPFGGFVRLKGENAITEKERRSEGSFAAASFGAKVTILIAGVFMNFILAIVVLTYGFTVFGWVPSYFNIEDLQAAKERGEVQFTLGVAVQDVISGGSAARAGVPAPSVLSAIDGESITTIEEVLPLQEGKNRVTYTILTGENFDQEEKFTIDLTDDGKAGVGIATVPFDLTAEKASVSRAFGLAIRESWIMTHQTVKGIGHLFFSLGTSGKVPEGISGIVGIAQLTHTSVQRGFDAYLRLVALLSLSLAVLNILPFPALDGGRLLFVLVEAISRREMNRKLELSINAFGFGFLILLIIVITFYDIIRLF